MLHKLILFRQRIDVEFLKEKPRHVEFLRFYKRHKEYELQGATDCTEKDFNRTFVRFHLKFLITNYCQVGAFSWVRDGAKQENNECHAKGKRGLAWSKVTNKFQYMVCVHKDDINTPYWVEHITLDKNESRRIEFKTFAPGTPDTSVFQIPAVCNH